MNPIYKCNYQKLSVPGSELQAICHSSSSVIISVFIVEIDTSSYQNLSWGTLETWPVNPKGSQSWICIERTDVEVKASILWLPDMKSWLIWKDPDAGKDWGQEEKRMTEDEMARWHHWLNGHESEWTPGVGDGQGGLACCNSWGRKESDTTERLIWSEV